MVNLFAKLFGKKKGGNDKDASVEPHKGKKLKAIKSPRKRGGRNGAEAGASTTSSATTEVAANIKTLPSVLSPNNSSHNTSPEKVSSPLSKNGTTSTSILLQNNKGTGFDFAPSTASTSKTSDRDSPPITGVEDVDPLRSPFSSKSARKQGPELSFGSQSVLSPHAGATSPPTRTNAGPVDLDEDNSVDDDEENMMRRHVAALPIFGSDGGGPAPPHLLNKQVEDHSQDDTSSFNISTDNEDAEYENLKRGGVPTSCLDQSVASTYKSDGETSIFPLLKDEDSQKGGDDKVFYAAWDPSSPMHDFPATSPTTKAGSSSNIAAFTESGGQPGAFASSASSSSNTKSFFKNSRPSRPQTSSSPNAQAALDPFKDDAFADFADFANFDTQWPDDIKGDNGKGKNDSVDDFSKVNAPFDQTATNTAKERSHIYIETGKLGNTSGKAELTNSGAASLSTRETSLADLLAQAKARRSVGSVSSAPVTSSYKLKDGQTGHHGSRSTSDGVAAASATDIIQNLGAAAQTKDPGSITAAKEMLKQRRQQKETDESDEAAESWLFDEVTGALGPRGIAADLESLSGRSQKSAGERSHKSHRSKSKRRHRKSSSGESIGSKDSKRSSASRRSRSSRYSHRSTKSYISQMSEQSRSVANDLLRLEMQLAMVGQSQNQSDGSGGNGDTVNSNAGSESGNRTSRSKTSATTSRRSTTSGARRSRITVMAPPGKLGIILANKADSKGTVVSGVRTSSVLAEKISPGDRIVAIDGEDVSLMTVSEITTIMARKAEFERTLTVLTTPRTAAQTDGSQSSSKYRS